ncbi:hypothetical protein GW891_00460 [bacterium]|nr:hypothetical protein [bacterium]
MQFKFDEKEEKENVLQSKRDELQKLNDIKIKVNSEESDVNSYISHFSEDELIDYIYSKIEEDNLKYTD